MDWSFWPVAIMVVPVGRVIIRPGPANGYDEVANGKFTDDGMR